MKFFFISLCFIFLFSCAEQIDIEATIDERAKKIAIAFDEAGKKGLGVVALGSKMIDPPVVKRALQTINLVISMKLLTKRWKE